MEGDWSSREGRLPRLDRDGRTLSDSEYCLPSPPERDLSTIHLSQASLDGGYGGDVCSEAGSSEIFHHCQQPSYAHSEGYYSYVSSTDSITPFIDRLKRELEFTEVQETSNASSHGGASLKWEESDTDSYVTPRERSSDSYVATRERSTDSYVAPRERPTDSYVAPRERSTNKTDSDSVWHFRGSSNDLMSSNYRSPPTISNSRLGSPPLSTESSRITYSSRVPLFNNASYESVSIDHTTRLGTQTNLHSNQMGLSQMSRIQPNYNNSAKSRNQIRSSEISYNRSHSHNSLNHGENPHPARIQSNTPTCDNSNLTQTNLSNLSNKESLRYHKASQNHRANLHQTSTINDSNANIVKKPHTAHSDHSTAKSPTKHIDSNHSSRIHPNHNDSNHHSNRVINPESNHTNKVVSNHNEPLNHSSRLQLNHDPVSYSSNKIKHSETANSNRLQSLNDGSNLSNRVHSNHGDSVHSSRIVSNHSDIPVIHSTKVQHSISDTSINHSSRTHQNHMESYNHSSRIHHNHSEQNSSRVHSSQVSSNDSSSGSHLRIHQGLSTSAESIIHSNRLSTPSTNELNQPSRISHSSHSSSSSESANIARSSRVPPPQRHLSQSVLYLSADHRKLFPISTYQPEPPRVVGAVSVSERVTELETRLGGLKAFQKKALLSFYQRHQASASATPVPPPPPRRASSASDYMQVKGSMDTSSTSSSSSQNSNSIKDNTSISATSISTTSSSNSLLKDSRPLHSRSCGTLSGISGPVIVGRSISVDDWVPARPPKGAHLRPSARPSSPEQVQPSIQKPLSPLRLSPLELQSAEALVPSATCLDQNSANIGRTRRPSSPELPPPPPSPPQEYSDEPLPPPPEPDELSQPPSLPTRHPSPGPQVPINKKSNHPRIQTDKRTSPDKLISSIKKTTTIEPPKIPVEINIDDPSLNLDIRPQKLTDISNQKNPELIEPHVQYNRSLSSSKKTSLETLSDSLNDLNSDLKENQSQNVQQIFPITNNEQKVTNIEISGDHKNNRISPLNNRNSPTKSQTDINSLIETKCLKRANLEIQQESKHFSNILDNLCLAEPLNPKKSVSPQILTSVMTSQDIQKQYNDSAMDNFKDISPKSSQNLFKPPSKENASQLQRTDKTLRSADLNEESKSSDKKSLVRKTSFRCSERILQSITSLHNSIRSSSPSKLEDVEKNILPDLTNEILSKELESTEKLNKESISADIMLNELLTKNLSQDSLLNDFPCRDTGFEEFHSAEKVTIDVTKDIASRDLISEETWSSATTLRKSPSGLAGLEHITTSSYTSRCFGEVGKEDGHTGLLSLSDCDIDKSSSSLQLDPSISVGSLQQKKEELVTRLSRKLSVLRAEAAAVAEETSANEELGETVIERVTKAWGGREASRVRSHVADLGRLTALLLTLTTRLARADNALLALPSSHPDKGGLETKRDRLAGQLEEARRLKEKVDKRNDAVTTKLRERLTADEYSDFMHFISLKSKLLLDSREIADKIKLGEEQLQALQMTLSAVT